MKAAVLTENEVVEVRDIPDPIPAADEVLIEVEASGICGSDMHAWHGRHPFRRPPVVLGHEVSGVVRSTGEAVTDVRVGDRVAVEPHRICGHCWACAQGRNELCVSKQYPGTGQWNGTLAELFVAPARMAHLVPDGVPGDLAALAEPLAVASHANRRGQVQAGQRVNIIGAGAIGLLSLTVARHLGADVDVVTDVDPVKLALAEALGATRPRDVRTDPIIDQMRSHRQGRADVTIVAATAPQSLQDAAALTRPGGTIVLLGLYAHTADVDAARLITDEQTIAGSLTYDHADFRSALSLLAAQTDMFSQFVTRRISLVDVDAEFRGQADGSAPSLKTLVLP